MSFNKSALTFTSTNSPKPPNPLKRGSKIGQWTPLHRKARQNRCAFLFTNLLNYYSTIVSFVIKEFFCNS